MRSTIFILWLWLLAIATPAAASEIPTVTLTEVGPDQEIPTDRSFYVQGNADPEVVLAQAVILRKGSPRLGGDAGPDCGTVLRALKIEGATHSAADDGDDDDEGDRIEVPSYDTGVHRGFEIFPSADRLVRDAAVLVSAAWQRDDDAARQYKVLVPHDNEFFATGYAFCMFVVTTERKQEIDDPELATAIDGLAKRLIACADRSSCQDEALDDYQAKVERMLSVSRSIAAGPRGEARQLAVRLREAAKSELGSATGLIDARDRLQDRWASDTIVMQPAAQALWIEPATDPLAHATATLLARSGALLPQVKTTPHGTAVTLYTTDGRLAVGAIQILDDGRSLRVAASRAPTGDKARVMTATTDTLPLGENLTLYDLLQLGHGKVHVDRDWISLEALGQRVTALGLDEWTAEDTAFLGIALAQLQRLQGFVEIATIDATCKAGAIGTSEAELTPVSVTHQLGDWLACQRIDGAALGSLVLQLSDLVAEDRSWKAAKDALRTKSRRIVLVTTTAPVTTRVSFETTTWVFSYVTPSLGYAGILRTNESFGLLYVAAQIHLFPNPVCDPQWAHGIIPQDMRRAIALEIGVAPTTGSFGPDDRFSGPGSLPPIFLGVALHVLPYTSFTVGAAFLDRKRSTLPEEDAHLNVSAYVGFTVQLNLPDLIRHVALTTSNTAASP